VKAIDLKNLGLTVARARVVFSLVILASVYVDRTTGGLFGISRCMLITLVIYFAYAIGAYLALNLGFITCHLLAAATVLDLLLASALGIFTEGPTSPALAMFLFAIAAAGYWASLRSIVTVTLLSVLLYLLVIVHSGLSLTNPYLMRAVYLGIVGYLIDFLGQEREKFERRLHDLEAEAERQRIARSLHDGYIQALAGISLRLETCRDMLLCDQLTEALTEVLEIQADVSREYDDVRTYVRSLGGAEAIPSEGLRTFDTEFRVNAAFIADGPTAEHLLQIVLESIRNTQQHAGARMARINLQRKGQEIQITVDDDGVGFSDATKPPWSMLSRVAEFGGTLAISSSGPGAHIDIAIPTK
jgi:signal transduction histidine kinase